ncbi:hypothetical protein BpHYR1_040662 [Brachionus plicatilis]|uniref:Uncharacterized protein n=1 Tax=Brachionus plicatilis TaxID=10195 RepID=A0A3M7RN64_BRAPC|nr:hypothetical protein BpHYR1_040662 [Brachionus plicatilis]
MKDVALKAQEFDFKKLFRLKEPKPNSRAFSATLKNKYLRCFFFCWKVKTNLIPINKITTASELAEMAYSEAIYEVFINIFGASRSLGDIRILTISELKEFSIYTIECGFIKSHHNFP